MEIYNKPKVPCDLTFFHIVKCNYRVLSEFFKVWYKSIRQARNANSSNIAECNGDRNLDIVSKASDGGKVSMVIMFGWTSKKLNH